VLFPATAVATSSMSEIDFQDIPALDKIPLIFYRDKCISSIILLLLPVILPVN